MASLIDHPTLHRGRPGSAKVLNRQFKSVYPRFVDGWFIGSWIIGPPEHIIAARFPQLFGLLRKVGRICGRFRLEWVLVRRIYVPSTAGSTQRLSDRAGLFRRRPRVDVTARGGRPPPMAVGPHSLSLAPAPSRPIYPGTVQFNIITLFPEFFTSPLRTSLMAKAITEATIEVNLIDLRHYGVGKHRQVDDAPFGGGAGMVMMVGPIAEALSVLPDSHKILLAPAGERLTQSHLQSWSAKASITLVCGRYEGVDQRVAEHLVDEEVSLGDFVVMGGEVGALAILEGVGRLIPGAVGNPESPVHESFSNGLLEEPHYTRPARYLDWSVPEVLLSGDHGAVEAWRATQRDERTRVRRPDLWQQDRRVDDSGT